MSGEKKKSQGITSNTNQSWMANVIKKEEYASFLQPNGADFINDDLIEQKLRDGINPSKSYIRQIINKSKTITRLDPEETAALLHVKDESLWEEIFSAGLEIKKTVYGPRVVTFAPLYCANHCVNSCLYCGFRKENGCETRMKLSTEEIKKETEALVQIGHKRLIMSYGEHPISGPDYIADSIRAVYNTKVGNGEIRRVNVNCAPMSIQDIGKMKEVGIGTYQVFQETYHHETYKKVHPKGIKADYQWRLYSMHRAMQAGVDDFGIGALFGLYDWKFEVLALLYHTIELETQFGGVGPHTISFPRLKVANNSQLSTDSKYLVSDSDFKRLVAVLRLSVPYTGLILTARESAAIRDDVINVGCTQIDADSKIGIGAYSAGDELSNQKLEDQQFELGDRRSLDQAIRDMAQQGYISGFCTACYRSKRTGDKFMCLAKDTKISHFCMPNAILTFKEYLLDYASKETIEIGEKLIKKEFERLDELFKPTVADYLERLVAGERDLMV